MRSLQTIGEVRLDDRKFGIFRRSARSWPARRRSTNGGGSLGLMETAAIWGMLGYSYIERGAAPLSLERGALPSPSLTAAVPISLREEGNADANNQVFGMICSLASNIEDPRQRFKAIIEGSIKSKKISHPMRARKSPT